MSKLPLRAAWKMALILGATGLAASAIGSAAWAVDASHATPALPPTDVPVNGGDGQSPADDSNGQLLPDRPDLAQNGGDELGPLYINHTAGIQLHVPRGSRKVLQVSQDILAEFDDPDRHWELKVAQLIPDKPTVLTTRADLNPSRQGPRYPAEHPAPARGGRQARRGANGAHAGYAASGSLPAAKVLREDLTSLPNGNRAIENNVGLLAIRYTAAGQPPPRPAGADPGQRPSILRADAHQPRQGRRCRGRRRSSARSRRSTPFARCSTA